LVERASPDEVLECFTADFGNGIEADIKIVNAEDGPYIDPILFDKGSQVGLLDVEYKLADEFVFEYDNVEYAVSIRPKDKDEEEEVDTYRVPCTWKMYGSMYVKARSKEEAIRTAKSKEVKLPEDAYYIPGTFKADKDRIEKW
jgi:hypothetical protein